MARVQPPPGPPSPTLYRAERQFGPDGVVEWWGEPLTDEEAIARLKSGEDVVIRGPTRRANRDRARELAEQAFGGNDEDQPHTGAMSLPHFHPPGRDPEVHVFFDSPARYARQRKPRKPKKGTK